jgi:hypothetical protein
MKTTKENFKKDRKKLIKGWVVVDSHGNEFITSDINDFSQYVWCGMYGKRTDWPITDHTIEQDILGVPDENGDESLRLCRFSMNEDCLTPYVESDFIFNEIGFIEYSR